MKKNWITFSPGTLLLSLACGTLGAWIGPLIARAATTPAPSSLSFAGTLRQNDAPVTGPQLLKFAFKKNGAAVCTTADLSVTADADGHFTAGIPIAGCPTSLFDGSEVKLDISVAGEIAVVDQPISSVPSAEFAKKTGFSDCPLGYDRDMTATSIVLCRSGADEVVRVGTKSTSFWIDRYEDSVWANPDGTGKQYGDSAIDYPMNPGAQSLSTTSMFAISKANVRPSNYISWFQANAACRQAGKRLPTGDEWLIAAQGTPDPGNGAGQSGDCNTGGTGTFRKTGEATTCTSVWGAQDMIGNYSEFTADWQAAPGNPLRMDSTNWGPAMGRDTIENVVSGASPAWGEWGPGIPSITVRGGGIWHGEGAGIFTYILALSPLYADSQLIVRCVIPR